MYIDKEKAIIYGENGSASYFINGCGGLELTDLVDNGITEIEFLESEKILK